MFLYRHPGESAFIHVLSRLLSHFFVLICSCLALCIRPPRFLLQVVQLLPGICDVVVSDICMNLLSLILAFSV